MAENLAEEIVTEVIDEEESKPRDIVGILQGEKDSNKYKTWFYIISIIIFRTGRQMQNYIAQDILKLLNMEDLANTQQVSSLWREVVKNGRLWKWTFDRYVSISNIEG